MTDPIGTIRSAIGSTGVRTNVEWTAVANAISQLAHAELSHDGEQALVDLIKPENIIYVSATDLPHSQSPEDMLKAAAIDALFKWTGQKWASLCVQVASRPVSPIVKRLVAFHFPDAMANTAEPAS